MYWRDEYATVDDAMAAEHLAGLGKIKLTPQQKAAISQAKADAKVAKVTAKANVKVAKLALKASKYANKQALSTAKVQAGVQSVTPVSVPADVPASLTSSQSDSGFSLAPSSAGPAGAGVPDATNAPAVEAAPSMFQNPMTLALIGGAVLLLLLMMKKR